MGVVVTTSTRGRALRHMLIAALLGLSVLAPAARADDLLLLNGDSVTLSGNLKYGFVYVDGDLRLAGSTSITANSIYFGPDAYLLTCFVAGTGDNGCTAGRSLTLRANGPLTVANDIDLTAGAGTLQPGGNLSLSGSPVTVGGNITTAGSGGAASGRVSISSGSSLATGGINAPGSSVTLGARGWIDVGDDIDTEGNNQIASSNPARVPSAGAVTVGSSAGNVRIDGDVNAYGQDAPTQGGLGGGNAAPVTITGSNVRTDAIYATGGGSGASVAGASSPIKVTARGSLNTLGQLDASGQNGATGSPTPAANITLSAAGPLTAGGSVYDDGAQGVAGGSSAETINVRGATVTTGTLSAVGGDTPAGGRSGRGGAILVGAPGGASLGALRARGGNAYGGGVSGAGGAVAVTSTSGAISVGEVETEGGYTGNGPGTDGGPITLSALGDLTIGGSLDASGSDGNGNADPPLAGGNAGKVLLRAATGTLSLASDASAEGGGGSSDSVNGKLGGRGGRGGRIDVVAHAIGPVVSLSSRGGDGGDYGYNQGPGGAGGVIYAWTDASLFDDQKVIDSDGGDGNPTGIGGHKQQDSSPTALSIQPSTGLLSFVSRSPDAQRYRVLRSTGGGAPQTVLETSATSRLKTTTPLCAPVTFTVVAVNTVMGWVSDPSRALAYVRTPSTSQSCSQAPRVLAPAQERRSLRDLRRANWVLKVPVKTNGVGTLQATLKRTGKNPPLATASAQLAGSGSRVLRLRTPAMRRGSYVLRIVTTSPNGRGHTTATTTLEVAR